MRATLHQRTCALAQDELSIRVCRDMFHRNLLGVPDPLPLFPTTLVKESGTTCADPQSMVCRLAEQRPLTESAELYFGQILFPDQCKLQDPQDMRNGKNWSADTRGTNRVERRQQLWMMTPRQPHLKP